MKLCDYEKCYTNGGAAVSGTSVENGILTTVTLADDTGHVNAVVMSTAYSRRVSEPVKLSEFTFSRLSETPRLRVGSQPESPSFFDEASSSNTTS